MCVCVCAIYQVSLMANLNIGHMKLGIMGFFLFYSILYLKYFYITQHLCT